jgi:hypothetical protein
MTIFKRSFRDAADHQFKVSRDECKDRLIDNDMKIMYKEEGPVSKRYISFIAWKDTRVLQLYEYT